MPDFLEFLFPFGLQEHAQDIYFSGFRQHTYLSRTDEGIEIPEIGRSGRGYQLCYNLKSVEQSTAQVEWPWSVRQLALHHSFDTDNGRSTWIVIKGNQLMQTRIRRAIKDGVLGISALQSVPQAFASTLAVHMLICDWSCENWRWYINFLDEELQANSRRALTSEFQTFPDATSEIEEQRSDTMPPHTASIIAPSCRTNEQHAQVIENWYSRIGTKTRAVAAAIGRSISRSANSKFPEVRPPIVLGSLIQSTTSNISDNDLVETDLDEPPILETSFDDWQKVHFIETRTNEALLVLKNNVGVLEELKLYYEDLSTQRGWMQQLISDREGALTRFENVITVAIKHHQMQVNRIETLLRLIVDRKNLVCPLDANDVRGTQLTINRSTEPKN
ncbi:hypothetical protein ACLMJK_007724 [Lecanora helva]